jgi:hypothetical protein
MQARPAPASGDPPPGVTPPTHRPGTVTLRSDNGRYHVQGIVTGYDEDNDYVHFLNLETGKPGRVPMERLDEDSRFHVYNHGLAGGFQDRAWAEEYDRKEAEKRKNFDDAHGVGTYDNRFAPETAYPEHRGPDGFGGHRLAAQRGRARQQQNQAVVDQHNRGMGVQQPAPRAAAPQPAPQPAAQPPAPPAPEPQPQQQAAAPAPAPAPPPPAAPDPNFNPGNRPRATVAPQRNGYIPDDKKHNDAMDQVAAAEKLSVSEGRGPLTDREKATIYYRHRMQMSGWPVQQAQIKAAEGARTGEFRWPPPDATPEPAAEMPVHGFRQSNDAKAEQVAQRVIGGERAPVVPVGAPGRPGLKRPKASDVDAPPANPAPPEPPVVPNGGMRPPVARGTGRSPEQISRDAYTNLAGGRHAHTMKQLGIVPGPTPKNPDGSPVVKDGKALIGWDDLVKDLGLRGAQQHVLGASKATQQEAYREQAMARGRSQRTGEPLANIYGKIDEANAPPPPPPAPEGGAPAQPAGQTPAQLAAQHAQVTEAARRADPITRRNILRDFYTNTMGMDPTDAGKKAEEDAAKMEAAGAGGAAPGNLAPPRPANAAPPPTNMKPPAPNAAAAATGYLDPRSVAAGMRRPRVLGGMIG